MIRQTAFEGKERLLKGGLHCHTTRSDGKVDPADVLRVHAQNGYDFLALTDHRYYNYANYAPETGVLVIPGMEMDYTLPSTGGIHCFHTVCIGPEKDKGNGFEQDQRFETRKVKDQFEVQPYLDEIHANGNLTFYCHPEWSNTPSGEYNEMKGHFAMEIWNSGCAIENELDTNAAGWDDLLSQGKRIFGVATDDGHGMHHHCNGWVNVRAEKNVSSILEALKAGAFYASCGPEIKDFYVEGDKAYVTCSPCKAVYFDASYMPTRIVRSGVELPETAPMQLLESENGLITKAVFTLRPEKTYIRVTVKDEQERRAWSNPIFLK